MQQHSENTKGKNNQIIHQFIQGLVDSRKREYKRLKETNLSCQKMIETRIFETPDVNHLLCKYEDDPWIKKILVGYILLQMYHHTIFYGVEDHGHSRNGFDFMKPDNNKTY